MEQTFGEFIKQVRKESGYTIQELSKIMNVSVTEISNWECDKRTPSGPNIMRIATALKIDFDTLYDMAYKHR